MRYQLNFYRYKGDEKPKRYMVKYAMSLEEAWRIKWTTKPSNRKYTHTCVIIETDLSPKFIAGRETFLNNVISIHNTS